MCRRVWSDVALPGPHISCWQVDFLSLVCLSLSLSEPEPTLVQVGRADGAHGRVLRPADQAVSGTGEPYTPNPKPSIPNSEPGGLFTPIAINLHTLHPRE
jgi:hypothetical protein